MPNTKLINPAGYEEFLLGYIKSMYEMDAPMIAGALERCLSKFRDLPVMDAVSQEVHANITADRDSWKDAFGESNELFTTERRRREAAERENRRMRAIIINHLPGDAVCRLCKYFAQCKQEALEDANDEEQKKTRFWLCDGYSHFSPNEDE